MIQDGQERSPEQDPTGNPESEPVTRVLHMDASGRVVRDPGQGADPDAPPVSLSDLLPESATDDLMAAIRAAADTGNAQFLEFDLLSEDGLRRIHAEAASDPDHQGEFVVTAREYSSPDQSNFVDNTRDFRRFAAFAGESDDLKAIWEEFARVLATQLDYADLTVVTVDPERDEQLLLFSTDDNRGQTVPLSGTAVEIVSRINEPLVVPTAIPSVIVVPLRSSGDTIAFVDVHSRAWESFDDHDLDLVEALSPPLAAALSADWHREDADRSSGERTASHAVNAISALAGDLRTMLEVAADKIHATGRFRFTRIESSTNDDYVVAGPDIAAARGVDPLSDAGSDESEQLGDLWSKTIGSGSESLGKISVLPFVQDLPDARDREFLTECARLLAQGVYRLRTEQQLSRLQAEVDASRELERTTAGLSDLETLVEMAAEEMKRLAGTVSLTVRVSQPGSTELRLLHSPDDPGTSSPNNCGDTITSNSETAVVVSMNGPAGAVGDVRASWDGAEAAQPGLRKLESMSARLAERVNAILLMEIAASDSKNSNCLAEIEATIRRSTDPAIALEECVSILSDRLDGARVSVAVLDSGRAEISDVAIGGHPVHGWGAGIARPLLGTIEESAATHTEPVSNAHASLDALVARWPSEAPAVGSGLRSFASVAIPGAKTGSAWLSVRSPLENGFHAAEIDLISRAAILLAGPVLTIKPGRSAEGKTSVLESLARVGHVSQAPSGGEVPYSRFAAELASLVEFDQVEIAELVGSGETARRVYMSGLPVPGWEPGTKFPVAGTVSESVVRSRTGLIVSGETPSEFAGRYPAQAAALAADLRSLAAAPMVIGGEPVGSLVLRSRNPEGFTRRDLEITEAVAVHVSAAMAQARLQERIDRQRRESEALATIGSSWDLGTDVVAERASIAFRRLVRCDGFVVTAVSADADTVRVVAAHGVEQADQEFFSDRVDRLRSRSDVLISRASEQYPATIRARIGSVSRPLGYVHAFSETPDAFSADDSDLLQRVADQLASIFERVRATDHSTRLSAERSLRRKLDNQNNELKELTISRDRFLRTIVHELQNPLMSVQILTDLLMKNAADSLGEEQLSQLAAIADSGEELKRLIENLLDVSQIQSDTFELATDEFDAAPLIRDVCQSFSGVLAVNGQRIELSFDTPDEPLWLKADRERISSLLSNLIANACKYSDEGTAVRVQVVRNGGQLQVAVYDQGIGISEEDLNRLFSPFERGTNPDALKKPGTGLGLVIARSIARLHGGDLVMESSLGVGTRARFHVEGVQDAPSEAYQARLAAEARGQSPE